MVTGSGSGAKLSWVERVIVGESGAVQGARHSYEACVRRGRLGGGAIYECGREEKRKKLELQSL